MQISGTATKLCPPPYLAVLSSQNDSQNQLISEVYYNGSGSANTNITLAYYYTYDTAGNLLTVEEGAVNSDGTITKTTVQTYTYGTGDWKDLLTAVNGNTIIYEGQTYNESTGEIEGAATGNPTTYYIDGVANTLTWTQGRQLARVSKPGAGVTLSSTYTYDADGIRTSKSVPINRRGLKRTYSYVTQNGKLVRQSWLNITMDFIYDESGRPFALVYTNGPADPVVYYYVLNLQGDVVGLTDASGTFVAQYTYNAWGEILSSTGDMAGINPLRYRGYYYDSETGFYYLQSRYYDPANHRFINADSYASTGQGIAGTNMFAYCNNNPVSYCDPNGTSLVAALLLLVGGICLTALTGCESEQEANWPDDCPYNYMPPGKYTGAANCYGYVFGYTAGEEPGESAGISIMDPEGRISVSNLRTAVLRDGQERGRDVYEISSSKAVPEDAYLVVCKLNSSRTDYHFAVRIDNNIWIDKPGSTESRYNMIDGLQDVWKIDDKIYDGVTLYFAFYKN